MKSPFSTFWWVSGYFWVEKDEGFFMGLMVVGIFVWVMDARLVNTSNGRVGIHFEVLGNGRIDLYRLSG
jgi:hypothetical protein